MTKIDRERLKNMYSRISVRNIILCIRIDSLACRCSELAHRLENTFCRKTIMLDLCNSKATLTIIALVVLKNEFQDEISEEKVLQEGRMLANGGSISCTVYI